MIDVRFPGGVAVEAVVKGHTVRTDQPEPLGANSAPSPFDLFLASLATCAGFYALRFCQERKLPTDGLGVKLEVGRKADGKGLGTVRIAVTAPSGFPEKYRDSLLRAVDVCAVKRAVLDPPAFEVTLA